MLARRNQFPKAVQTRLDPRHFQRQGRPNPAKAFEAFETEFNSELTEAEADSPAQTRLLGVSVCTAIMASVEAVTY